MSIDTALLKVMLLRSVCDDYESIETIFPDIVRDVGEAITREGALQRMHELVEEGLVTAFRFDNKVWSYVPIAPDAIKKDSWFLATEKGKAVWIQRREKFGSGIRRRGSPLGRHWGQPLRMEFTRSK